MFNLKRNIRRLIFQHLPHLPSSVFYSSRNAAYIFISILMIYALYTLYDVRSGIYVGCRCYSEIETEERVERYLATLLKEKSLSGNRLIEDEAEEEHPSLPVKFLADIEANGQRCSILPGFFDIKHRNFIWQEAQIGTSTFLLFSAFMDHRDEKEGPLIRILAMADTEWVTMPTCHLYYSSDASKAPVATKAIRVEFIHWQVKKRGEWHPYLITCRGGSKDNSPKVVSIVSYPCSKPTNALRIIPYNTSKRNGKQNNKKKLALCHKFLFNNAMDYSYRIIEWLEIAKAFGVDQVTMYMLSVHPNVKKVFDYYSKTGFLKIIQWTNPGTQLNVPSLLRSLYDTQRYVTFTVENIPFTDCLLRYISSHDYVGVWDIDEFMIPIKTKTIPEMVENAYNNWKLHHQEDEMDKPPTSYLARTSYFLDDNIDYEFIENNFKQTLNSSSFIKFRNRGIDEKKMSSYFPFLSHTIRTTRFSPLKRFTKSIHDTSRALALHAHFALYNLEGRIDRETDLFDLDPQEEGFIGHFRSKCQGENQTICNLNYRATLEDDKTLWMYSQDIIYNTLDTINELQLF